MNAHEWNLICIFVSSDRLAGWALNRAHMTGAGRACVDHDFYQLWQLDDHSGSRIFLIGSQISRPPRLDSADETRKAARFPGWGLCPSMARNVVLAPEVLRRPGRPNVQRSNSNLNVERLRFFFHKCPLYLSLLSSRPPSPSLSRLPVVLPSLAMVHWLSPDEIARDYGTYLITLSSAPCH